MQLSKYTDSYIGYSSLIFVALCMLCIVNCTDDTLNRKPYLQMPKLGVGILDIKSDVEKESALMLALNAGYRMIDVWEG